MTIFTPIYVITAFLLVYELGFIFLFFQSHMKLAFNIMDGL